MSESNNGILDKAESLARRILERVGSKVDTKLLSGDGRALSPYAIGELTSRLERLIESSLEKDEQGIPRLAPNRFLVLLTYEETSKLSPQYIEATGSELTAMVLEYIGNRRYVTRGPVAVEIGRDLFVKETVVKASFEGAKATGANGSAQSAGESKAICFTDSKGRRYRVELQRDSAPAYIGRAAGAALRIDDPSLSRLHCSLSLRSTGEVMIADLGSANGTHINHQQLGADEARPLAPGDVVEMGDFRLTVSDIS